MRAGLVGVGLAPAGGCRDRGGSMGRAWALALLLVGCRDAPPPVDTGGITAPETDAGADRSVAAAELARRLNERFEDVPLPTGERLWGVPLPIGCVPDVARVDWAGFRCHLAPQHSERFYRFRFPLFEVVREGDGRVVRPPDASTGYARIQGVHRGTTRSRLTVFRQGARADDPTARGLLQRLNPARDEAPPPRRRE